MQHRLFPRLFFLNILYKNTFLTSGAEGDTATSHVGKRRHQTAGTRVRWQTTRKKGDEKNRNFCECIDTRPRFTNWLTMRQTSRRCLVSTRRQKEIARKNRKNEPCEIGRPKYKKAAGELSSSPAAIRD